MADQDPVRRALAPLDEGPRRAAWGDVRALARRRRRAVGATVASVVVVLGILVAIVVPKLRDVSVGPTTPPPAPLAAGVVERARLGSATELAAKISPLGTADPKAVAAVAKAEQQFTADLLQQATKGATDNVSTSPASLAIALSMLQTGAVGRTLGEISTTLGTPSLAPTAVDEGWSGLTSDWAAAAKSAGIEFSAANSLWQQRGLQLRPDYLTALTRYFDSGVWQVDFAKDNAGALKALDQWTSEHTHGKITKLFDSLDPETLLVLANAVYFHAAWQTPFDASQSEPGSFTAADGSRSTATFMQSPAQLPSVTTPTYQAAQLPYQGGRFAALAVMPTQGSLTDFIAGLDGGKLAGIASSLSSTSAVKLPKFTTTSTTDLAPVLQAMGIRQAFTDDADFSGMSTTPMKVGQAVQRVYLKVGEKGTEAAAVTGTGMLPTALPVETQGITFDHPFLFLVRDTKTGAVLFASQITHPDTP